MLRWVVPAALLVAEYLCLSFLVDLPTSGPALQLAQVVRLAVPVAISAAAAGWLLARDGTGPARAKSPPPAWRPWPALALQPVAFAATAGLAVAFLRTGAPPASTAAVLAILLCASATLVLAVWSAAPPSWFAGQLARNWGYPLVALALGLLAWRTATAAEDLWGVLSDSTLRAAALLLRVASPDVTVGPAHDLISVGDFHVLVTTTCSGADGLGLVVLFQGTWIALARRRVRVRRALLLVPLGAAAAFAANALRIAMLVWVGGAGHVALAAGGLHSKLGWILFIAIALGTISVAEHISWFQREAPAAPASSGEVNGRAGPYVAPLLAALATALVTSVWSHGPGDPWYVARILAATIVLLLVRGALPLPSLTFSSFAVSIGVLVSAIWVGATQPGSGPPVGEVLAAAPARWGWIAARLVGSCLVIPIVEELAFRGFLLRWLVSPEFERLPARAWTWPAVVMSSVAFGALHSSWALGTLAGVLFAAARLRHGRLGDAMVAHAVANAGIAAAVLLLGRWDLWR